MIRKRRFKFDKLIRDKIPEIIRAEGAEVFERIMNKDEYINRLREKLVEEAQEVLEAKNTVDICEELADVLEVMIALCQVYNFSFEKVEQSRTEKKAAKGGFEKRIYNAFVEVESHHESICYYLERPHKYPELK